MTTIQALSSISSFLGLLAVLAYFYSRSQERRAERSVREIVEGDPLFNANQIVEILRLFNDDARRLDALASLAQRDRDKAKDFLAKIKANVDVEKLQTGGQRHRQMVIAIAGVVLLGLGLFGLLWARNEGNGNVLRPGRDPATAVQQPPLVESSVVLEVTELNLREVMARHQISVDALIVDGVQVEAPAGAVYIANRFELRNGGEIVGSDFAVITSALIGGRLAAIGTLGNPGSSPGANGTGGGRGGRLVVAAARVQGTKLQATGGMGGDGARGATGVAGSNGSNGQDGQCGPGALGQFRGSTDGGSGAGGGVGEHGGSGGGGGQGGELFLLTLRDASPEIQVDGGMGGRGGEGGAGGPGGAGGKGGAGCNGLGGSQPTRPNGRDGQDGAPGEAGSAGPQGASGTIWHRRLDDFGAIVATLKRSPSVTEVRDALVTLTRQ